MSFNGYHWGFKPFKIWDASRKTLGSPFTVFLRPSIFGQSQEGTLPPNFDVHIQYIFTSRYMPGWTSLLNHTFHILGIILIDLICMCMSVYINSPWISIVRTHVYLHNLPIYHSIVLLLLILSLYIYNLHHFTSHMINSSLIFLNYGDFFHSNSRFHPDSLWISHGFLWLRPFALKPRSLCRSVISLWLVDWSRSLEITKSPVSTGGSPEELVSWKSQSEMDDD